MHLGAARPAGSFEGAFQRGSGRNGDIDHRAPELLHGAAKSAKPVENRRAVEDFASRVEVLPFDDRDARHAADIKTDLERAGMMIGSYDLLIAGHARSQSLAIVTGNLGEFQRVRGLVTEDWA